MRLLAANLRHCAHGGPLDGRLVGGEHFDQPFRNGPGARPDSAQGVGGIYAGIRIIQERDDRRGRAGRDGTEQGNGLERGDTRGLIGVAEQEGQLVCERSRPRNRRSRRPWRRHGARWGRNRSDLWPGLRWHSCYLC